MKTETEKAYAWTSKTDQDGEYNIWISENGDINSARAAGCINPHEVDEKTLDFEAESTSDFEVVKTKGSEICRRVG